MRQSFVLAKVKGLQQCQQKEDIQEQTAEKHKEKRCNKSIRDSTQTILDAAEVCTIGVKEQGR